MRSPVDTLTKESKEANKGNMKITVGSVVTSKAGEVEDNTRVGRIVMTR